jgi:hypothetical protein
MADLTTTAAVTVELRQNPLPGRTGSYYGRVINIASVGEDALIERALAAGFEGNAISMKATYRALAQAALNALVRGEIVHFGPGHFALDVEGSFGDAAAGWDAAKHRLTLTVTASKALQETLKTTPVRVIGLASNRAAILRVTDMVSGQVNRVLTPGGMAAIKGTRIKIDGDNPAVGLFLTNRDTGEAVRIAASAIGLNEPKTVVFVVPAGLAHGYYYLSIVTQVGGNISDRLREPRTITSYFLFSAGG